MPVAEVEALHRGRARARWHVRWRLLGVGLAWLVLLGVASRASAASPRARLAWERPALSMCPAAETLEHDVSELLGHDPFVHDAGTAAELALQGYVEEREDEVYARIEASANGQSLGVRELSAPRGECAGLRKPLALIIGLFLEVDAPPAPHVPTHARVPLWLGGFGALRTDLLPRATGGVGVGLLARVHPRLDVAAQLAYWLPVSIETAAGLGARLQGLDASLGLCPRLMPASAVLGVQLCAGSQVGVIFAAPRGLDDAARKERVSAAALLELKLDGAVHERLVLEGALGLLVALTRPLFYLTRSDGSTLDVHRPDRFGFMARLTLFFRLPS